MSTNIRLVNSLQGFEALQKDWDALYQKCDRVSVFNSWDWVYTWWEVFKDQFQRELFILCLYKDNALVGIAPFQITQSFPKSLVQGKTLQFIGNGEAYEDSIISEFQDLMVLPELETEMVEAVSNYLSDNTDHWNFADFEFLLKDALILQCFKQKDSAISRKKLEYGVRFTIPQSANFEEYHANLGRRWRRMYNKKNRVIERDGEVSIGVTETVEDIPAALEQLAEMNCYRWRDRTGSCIFDSSRFKEFHKKIMQRLVPQQKAAIKTLYLDDEALASYYVFSDKDRIHYYQSGFHAKHANRYSPLFLLVCKEIGVALEKNQFFDFMFADDSESYKKDQYACDYESMYRLHWAPQKYRFTLFSAAKKSKASLANIKGKVTEQLKKISKEK